MRSVKILCIIVLFLSSSLIYYYPNYQYSDAPSQFNGGGKYFHDYLITNGHTLQRGDIETFGVFSNAIYGQTETPAAVIFSAIKHIIVIPSSNSSWNYSLLFYFFAAISFSLSVLLFYHPTSKKSTYTFFSIVAFSLFGVPYIISNIGGNAGIGWTLIVLILYTYTKGKSPSMRLILIILLISLPLIYFTPSSVLLLILSSLLIYNILHKNYKASFQLTLIYFTLWLSTSIYISIGRFTGVVNTLSKVPLIIKEGFVQSSAGVGSSEVLPYLITTSSSNKIMLLINAVFVVVPVIYFLFIGYKKFNRDDQILHIIWAYVLSLIPFTFLLFVWLGFWGIARLTEWGGVLSFLVFSAIVGKTCKSHEIILTFFITFAIITSIFGYTINENRPTGHLTFEEEYSANWLIKHIHNSKSVFTDFRISGYFVGNNHLRVTGINNIDYPLNSSINYINSIYYSNDSTEAENTLAKIKLNNGQKMNYLLFSDQMTKNIPGIKLYDYAFKPAPNNFTEKYDTSSFTHRIYDNGKSMNYYMIN